jgi:hypothetical protein
MVETKKKSLGIAVPKSDKKNPNSYDLSGSIDIAGVKYRFGAYKSIASGEGKMPKGSEYYWFHRVEVADVANNTMSAQTSFNVDELEKM